MATFDQAYWYTHTCPLRRLSNEVAPESESGQIIRSHVHAVILNAFKEKTGDILLYATKNIDMSTVVRVRAGITRRKILEQIHHVLTNVQIWKSKHVADQILLTKFDDVVHDMHIDIDVARLKSNKRIQLIWLRYDTVMPTMNEFARLVERAQWNARGYELISETRPMQLTYYFPMMETEYSVLYNTDGRYELIAELIEKEAFYMQPSMACDTCFGCSMSWEGFKGAIDEENKHLANNGGGI